MRSSINLTKWKEYRLMRIYLCLIFCIHLWISMSHFIMQLLLSTTYLTHFVHLCSLWVKGKVSNYFTSSFIFLFSLNNNVNLKQAQIYDSSSRIGKFFLFRHFYQMYCFLRMFRKEMMQESLYRLYYIE